MKNNILDCLGIGFGPANLALAIQLHDYLKFNQLDNLSFKFFEKQENFCWHTGMLLEGTDVQIHYLKDLVTMVDPSNYFTFLNYLNKSGRLMSFINLRTHFPSRYEYNDYLQWAASHFSKEVQYGSQITRITPVKERHNCNIEKICVEYEKDGRQYKDYARNIVIATGQEPNIPDIFKPWCSRRIFHSSRFRQFLEEEIVSVTSPTVVVIGSGQSAAEVFSILMGKFPEGKIINLMRAFGYAPADDSHFNNEVFNTNFIDYIYSLKPEQRTKFLDAFKQTNYSAVDLDLIKEIYNKLYQLKVVKQESKAFIQSHTEVVDIQSIENSVLLETKERLTGKREKILCDYVILATGYQYKSVLEKWLQPLENYLIRGNQDQIQINRNYQVITTPELNAGIYAMGYAEQSHGLTETLLSALPFRAKNLLQSLVNNINLQQSQPVVLAE
jgi:L-ornithine N5-monooxygenase